MDDRNYYFSPELRAIAEKSGIAEIAQKIYDGEENLKLEPGYSPYPWSLSRPEETDEDLELFRHSEEFSALRPDERKESITAQGLEEYQQWGILSGEYTTEAETIFPVTKYLGKIAIQDVDRLTLSGLGGVGFIDYDPEIFKDYTTQGFDSTLSYMQFAGAWLYKIAKYDEKGPSILLDSLSSAVIKRKIQIGGDIHGDFRMSEELLPAVGSITPYGKFVRFSPTEKSARLAGYHSIEKSIVSSICAYLIDTPDLNMAEKLKLFELLLSEKNLEDEPQKGALLYGDFGDDNSTSSLVKLDIDSFRLRGKNGQDYCSFIVVPGNDDARLILKKTETGLFEFSTTYSRDLIQFRPEQIPELLGLFLRIGGAESRTSKSSILHALYFAREELVAMSEPGHIIFGDK